MALYSFPSRSSNKRNEVVRAIFWDKDGVINRMVQREGYKSAPWHVSEFVFLDHVQEAFDITYRIGFENFIVTNQPDVYAGNMHHEQLSHMMKMCIRWLKVSDVRIAYERGSAWYKPNNGMIEALIRTYKVDRHHSFMVGDRWKDIVAGYNSGLRNILINSFYHYNPPEKHIHISPDKTAADLIEAVDIIEMEFKNGIR